MVVRIYNPGLNISGFAIRETAGRGLQIPEFLSQGL